MLSPAAIKPSAGEDGGVIKNMNNKLFFISIVLLGIMVFFLVLEHRVHLYGFVPYVFFVIFIGLHFFMHAGMGHGKRHGHDNKKK